ncbi:MAG TPA: AMP-binding protein, partial [Geminicoccaceae bacterium]|nr:AMP-binding protein [Geminicoccaceae bacterium]
FEGVTPDTVAAVFFTSGSTGRPKGVVTTQRMICANQQAIAQVWPFLAESPPVLLDWLPWHHTFGGNDNLHKMLWHGGALYIDRGRPTPERFGESAANLREVAPTLYINVPRGLELLLPWLERDAELRGSFFRRLDLLFFAGAALPAHVWDRFLALARDHAARTGRRPAFVSGYGSTEAGSTVCLGHAPSDRPDAIGLPLPGFDLHLVPVGAKLEVRVRGPNVTPGYWRRDDLTAAAFDAEGYYRTGDAVRFLDEADPSRGLLFDGRLADEFKLTSGTWVAAGQLRLGVLAACGAAVQDAVVVGEGRTGAGLLAFADLERCRALAGPEADALPGAAVVRHPAVRGRFAADLARWNAAHPGSSERVVRAALIAEPPSADAGEVTDKGQLSRRAVIGRRADLVRRLYDDPPPPEVVALDRDG